MTLEKYIKNGYVITARIKKALRRKKPLGMAKMAITHALEVFPREPFKSWAEGWLEGEDVTIHQCDTIANGAESSLEDYDLMAQSAADSAAMAIMWSMPEHLNAKLAKQWAYDSIEESTLAYLVKKMKDG